MKHVLSTVCRIPDCYTQPALSVHCFPWWDAMGLLLQAEWRPCSAKQDVKPCHALASVNKIDLVQSMTSEDCVSVSLLSPR